jgi:hypothetical protein
MHQYIKRNAFVISSEVTLALEFALAQVEISVAGEGEISRRTNHASK